MPLIDIKNLSYAYREEEGEPISVLKGIDLSINEGEYVVILGHNGSGKSTLAKLMNMVVDDYEFAQGQILVDGIDVLSEEITDDDGGYGFPEPRQPVGCDHRGGRRRIWPGKSGNSAS